MWAAKHCSMPFSSDQNRLFVFGCVLVTALHRHRKGLGSILVGGPIVDDEFFSIDPGLNFDMCMTSTQINTLIFEVYTIQQWTIPLLDKVLNSENQLAQLERVS